MTTEKDRRGGNQEATHRNQDSGKKNSGKNPQESVICV